MGIWTVRAHFNECQEAKVTLKHKQETVQQFPNYDTKLLEDGLAVTDRLSAYHELIAELHMLHNYFIDAGKARMSFMANTFIILSFIGFIPAAIASLEALRDQRGLGIAILAMMCGCTLCAFLYVLWYRVFPSIVHHFVLKKLLTEHCTVFGESDPDESTSPCRRPALPLRDSQVTTAIAEQESTPQPSPRGSEITTTIPKAGSVDDQSSLSRKEDGRIQLLEAWAINSANHILIFLRIFPVLEIFNAVLYALIIFCQLAIVVVLKLDEQPDPELPTDSSDDPDSPYRAKSMQWIFTLWILVMNVIFSSCNHSPSPKIAQYHKGLNKEIDARRTLSW
ncbi:hypothetical protein BJV82DRAFT_574806 [Fennellomyces sp. T-0311]|nr:hypothetical protein BJV82DRAFT_574806 [Fennellomyces sp. T-0311]